MNILFVCSSNICRSPYCEYVFRRMVQNDPVLSQKITGISSSAVFNRSFVIHPKAVKALEREGFTKAQAKAHRPSFKWDARDRFEQADVIIGMTKSNKPFVPAKYKDKFTTLSEAATGHYEIIPDPYLYRDMDRYYAAMDKIKEYLELYAQKLRSEK
jgi:protein-tyrosine-phosphatase